MPPDIESDVPMVLIALDFSVRNLRACERKRKRERRDGGRARERESERAREM